MFSMKYITNVWLILILFLGGWALPFDVKNHTSSQEKTADNSIVFANHNNAKALYPAPFFVVEDEEEDDENDDIRHTSSSALVPALATSYITQPLIFIEKKFPLFDNRVSYVSKKLFLLYRTLKIAC